MKKKFNRQNKNRKSGFAILFAVLLASFLITLGISIFSISLKEIQINTSLRDSQIAYYVADSARECALYWDVKKGIFPTCLDSSCSNRPSSNPVSVDVTCNSATFPLVFNKIGLSYSTGNSPIENFFTSSSTSQSSPVSGIKINKEYISATVSVKTTIETYGRNTKIIGRRVERGIRQVNNQ